MTLEGEEPGRDDAPAPPARTRWSEDTADDEAGLMPPYVPGGRTSATAQPEAGQGHQEADFPYDAFDLEGTDDEAPVESAATEEEPPAAAASPSDELAGRLERLADALRRDGRAAVDRELGSEDRLTSLLAGVVAGYLAGLDA